jgi:hypothetical protein
MSVSLSNPCKEKRFYAERRLSLIIHTAILMFFSALYWLMTMTGEDVSQFTTYNHHSAVETLRETYRYLPRIGEIYHNLIVRCYEPVARMNFCLVPRLMDVCLAIALLYALTWLALSRRPRFDLRSSLAIGIIFAVMMLTPANAIFVSRFSILHNYVLGYLIMVLFCIPFADCRLAKTQDNSIGAMSVLLLLGLLTGYSTEVSPAILILLLASVLILRYRSIKIIQRWMISGLSGLLIGVVLFYASGGLNSRTHGSYADAYDYVFAPQHPGGSLNGTVHQLFDHLLFNGRYLWISLLFLMICGVAYFILACRNPAKSVTFICFARGSLTFILLLYSALYLGISSVIRVDNELYGRYMAGVYLCVALAAAQMADSLLFQIIKMKPSRIIVLSSMLVAFIFTINLDMLYGFNKYNVKCQKIFSQLRQCTSMSIDESDLAMHCSPLFHFHQYPFLESWANTTAFGVSIRYSGEDTTE